MRRKAKLKEHKQQWLPAFDSPSLGFLFWIQNITAARQVSVDLSHKRGAKIFPSMLQQVWDSRRLLNMILDGASNGWPPATRDWQTLLLARKSGKRRGEVNEGLPADES
jgi:hypothetical protein